MDDPTDIDLAPDAADIKPADLKPVVNVRDNGESTDCRATRIQEHVDNSLRLSDPLLATIGAATGDLLLMQHQLQQCVNDVLQQQPESLSALAEALPAVKTLMKVYQQVDRYVLLSRKLEQAGQVGQ